MGAYNRVHVEIRGRTFNLLADDSAQYLMGIAGMADDRMKQVMEHNPQLNFEKAALLTALNFCDDFEKYKLQKKPGKESSEDHIREQVMEYAKELEKATDVIKNLEKELERVKSENNEQLEKLRREYEIKEKEILEMIDSM